MLFTFLQGPLDPYFFRHIIAEDQSGRSAQKGKVSTGYLHIDGGTVLFRVTPKTKVHLFGLQVVDVFHDFRNILGRPDIADPHGCQLIPRVPVTLDHGAVGIEDHECARVVDINGYGIFVEEAPVPRLGFDERLFCFHPFRDIPDKKRKAADLTVGFRHGVARDLEYLPVHDLHEIGGLPRLKDLVHPLLAKVDLFRR